MATSPINLERLILRLPALADAEAIYRGGGTDPEVTRYVMWRPHRGIEDTLAYLRMIAERWETGIEYTWLICLKPDGLPIGAISLRLEGFKGNMGYLIAHRH